MAESPVISVIMPVYNGARFLGDAVESILNQMYRDFEFIIIDDGSTDATPTILAEYAAYDPRIRVETQPTSQGIVVALNRGCELAQGRYIARMDADDYSWADRLQRQTEYLESHPEIGILGTAMCLIDEHGLPGECVFPPLSPGLVRWRAFFTCPMVHPSIMMRTTLIKQIGFYRPGTAPVEDYDLWLRASAITQLANLPDVLLSHRVWGGSISGQYGSEADMRSAELAHHTIASLFDEPIPIETTTTLRTVMALEKAHWPVDPAILADTAGWLVRLCQRYIEQESDSLTRAERHYIMDEVAFWLMLLGRRSFKLSPQTSLTLGLTALRLHPMVVWRVMGEIGERIFQRRRKLVTRNGQC